MSGSGRTRYRPQTELQSKCKATEADLEQAGLISSSTDEALLAGFDHLPLFVEGFAVLLRKGHPILASRDQAGHIDPSLLAASPRVMMRYPDGIETGVDDSLAAYVRPLGPGDLRTPHFLSAPLCVIDSDGVLCVPRGMAELVAAQGRLAVVDIPEAGTVTCCMIWHESSSSTSPQPLCEKSGREVRRRSASRGC